MDAAVGEVNREVLGLDLAPLKEVGGGVIEGIEGGGVILLPAQLAQCAPTAYLFSRPVKDDGGVFLLRRWGAAHAVVQLPERLRRPVEMSFQGCALWGVRYRFPQDPLSTEDPPGQGQKQQGTGHRFQKKRLGQFLAGGQHGCRCAEKEGQRRHAPPSAFCGAQSRHAVGGGKQSAGPGREVRDESQPQPCRHTGHGTLIIGSVGQQGTQQDPAHGDVQDGQVA